MTRRPILQDEHPLYIKIRSCTIKTLETAERISLKYTTKIPHPNNPLHHSFTMSQKESPYIRTPASSQDPKLVFFNSDYISKIVQ